MSDFLTTREAARMARVGPTAIKRWADSGALPCVKTAGGHRRFDRRELERFLRGGSGASGGDALTGSAEWLDLLAGDSSAMAVEGKLLERRARLGAWHRVAGEVGDLLVALGERWRQGRVTIAEEHAASERLARALARIGESIPLASGSPRCLLACAEGDEHTLGLSLVELCLEEAGWATIWAGRYIPTDEVVERIRLGGIGMVALSASELSANPESLARQSAAIGRACQQANIPLAFGGTGAWPDPPPYGRRFHSLDAFAAYATDQRRGR